MASGTDKLNLSKVFARGWYWGVPLFAFIGMIVLLISGDNTALFLAMNSSMSQGGDTFWSHVTIMGDSVIAVMFILPFLHRRPDIVWQFVLTAFLAGLTVYLLKDPDILRPPAVLGTASIHIIGPELRHVSFPSGHTTTAFLLAGLFCMQAINSWIKAFLLLLAVLAGLSRIACGVHWPMDVLGGMFFGWMAAVAGIWLGKHWIIGQGIWMQRTFALLFTMAAFWSIFYYDNAYSGTAAMQIIVTLACMGLSIPGQIRLFKHQS